MPKTTVEIELQVKNLCNCLTFQLSSQTYSNVFTNKISSHNRLAGFLSLTRFLNGLEFKPYFNHYQQNRSDNKSPGLVTIKCTKGFSVLVSPGCYFSGLTNKPREYIAYRRDSRLELLIAADQPFDFNVFEQQLLQCMKD